MTDVDSFMKLFQPLPGNRYLKVAREPDASTKVLSELLESLGGVLRLSLYTDERYDMDLEIEYIREFSQTFRALAREHDKVIIKDIYHNHQNKSQLLQSAYRTLANNAEIIIVEKKDLINKEQVCETLIEHEFRSPNNIDILEDYEIIVARKMHMWGNGL